MRVNLGVFQRPHIRILLNFLRLSHFYRLNQPEITRMRVITVLLFLLALPNKGKGKTCIETEQTGWPVS